MRILIAPNAFKNALGAMEAAQAIDKGLRASGLPCSTILFPIGDGGDGTGSLLSAYLGARDIPVVVKDPLGREVRAAYHFVDRRELAIIEMANASGLRLLQSSEKDPLHANSYGTGQLLSHAWSQGAKEIILCVGGSATIDGGTGALQALGFEFYDDHGAALHDLPFDLAHVDHIRYPGYQPWNERPVTILCDVTNPPVGKSGAAQIFGPQKGAGPEEIEHLEKGIMQLLDVIEKQTGNDLRSQVHGGAAGAIVAGLSGCIKAKPVMGIDQFLSLTSFSQQLENADLLITGEGSIDLQTLNGKGPYGVALLANEKNIPVIAFAGQLPDGEPAGLLKYFHQLININPDGTSTSEAISRCATFLELSAMKLGQQLSDKGLIQFRQRGQ